MTSFSDSIFARALRRLAQAVWNYPGWFVFPQIVLAVLCVLYTTYGLKFDMDRSHLIGKKMKSQKAFSKFRKEFLVQDELVVLVESASPERSRQFIERLAARVKPETGLFSDLFYKADFTALGPKALLLAPAADLEEMRKSLHDYLPFLQQFSQATNFVSLFELVNKQFRTASPSQTAKTDALIQAIPFLQRLVVQARQSPVFGGNPPPPGIETLFGGAQAEQQIYITFGNGRIYLLTVRPESAAATAQAIDRLRELIGQTQIEVPGVDVGLTGGPVLDYDEMRQSEHDTTVASIVALILCSLIFIIAYQQVGRPLKAAFCLLLGLGYTLGFTTVTIGHLNILSITFVPMLIGLAIDFGVHFITRYEEEMRNGRTEGQSLYKATVFTGQGIVTGGFTTAAAFLAMGLTNFKAIREMGIISGGGLLLCLIPMMTTLPALLLRGPQNLRDHQIGPRGQRRLKIENLWLQRPWLVISVAVLLCAAAAPQFHRVYFDYNLLDLQSQRLASVMYEEKLLHSGGRSVIFAAVMADSARQAQEYEQKLKQLSSVGSVESVADYFTEDQSQKLEIARSIKREVAGLHFGRIDRRPVQIDSLSPILWYLTGYLGLAADHAQSNNPALARQLSSFRESINSLRRAMHSDDRQIPEQLAKFQQALFEDLHQTFAALKNQDTSGPLRPQDLPPALRDRFIGVTGTFLLQVYPKEDIWQHETQREFIQQLQSVIPPDKVAGTPIELYEYTTLLKLSYQQAAGYSLAAIAIVIFLHFRSLLAVLLALVPVGLGAAWLLGFMGLAGIPFNPANIMTLPLVVGIGVTNGVQILNRFVEEQHPRILAKSTGKSVLVSGLTAMTGFGTLISAQHRGIRSLGEVMTFGIAVCMVAALTVLPTLLWLLMRWGWTMKVSREEPQEALKA